MQKRLIQVAIAAAVAVVCLLMVPGSRAQGGYASGSPFPVFKFAGGQAQPASGATITVCSATTQLIPVPRGMPGGPICPSQESDANCCFSDLALTQRLNPNGGGMGQPFPADSRGNVTFTAIPGAYQVTVSGGGIIPYTFVVSVPCVPGNSAQCGAFTNAPNTWGALQAFSAGITGTGSIGTLTAPYGNLTGFPSACGANQFATQIAATPGCVQPAFSNLSGNISTSQMNSGTGASSSTFWRGDGTWIQPSFSSLSGNISTSQMNGGSGASSSTFWRGDGTWAAVPLGVTTAYLTSNFTDTGTAFANVTGLSFSVSANTKYKITCDLDYQVTGNGIQIQWTGPASPTFVTYDMWADLTTGSSTISPGVATAFSTALQGNTTGVTGPNLPLRLTMTLSNGANAGTVQLQAASTGATATVTIIPGSCSLQQ